MDKVIRKYRSSDGKADYRFSFEEQPNRTWRAYILEQPSYGNRASDGHSTHRFSDEERKMTYVCWTNPFRSLDEAKKVAAIWADKTQEYIRTGSKF
jgi:hypothetical protein